MSGLLAMLAELAAHLSRGLLRGLFTPQSGATDEPGNQPFRARPQSRRQQRSAGPMGAVPRGRRGGDQRGAVRHPEDHPEGPGAAPEVIAALVQTFVPPPPPSQEATTEEPTTSPGSVGTPKCESPPEVLVRTEPLLPPGHASGCACTVPHRQDRCFRERMYPVTVFAPAPVRPVVSRWKGSCPARCRFTGRSCALPAGHPGVHASGRVQFTAVAWEGQTSFSKRDELEAAAVGRPESLLGGGR